jgi:hypothetical protein
MPDSRSSAGERLSRMKKTAQLAAISAQVAADG